jgi:hypothetical protein
VGRPPRHLVLIALGLAACGGSDDEPSITLTEPFLFASLVPTRTIPVAWTAHLAGDGEATVDVRLVAEYGGADQLVFDGPVREGATSIEFPAADQPFPAPGVYTVEARLASDGVSVEAESDARVGVQGIVFTEPAIGERLDASAGTRADIELDGTTFGTLALALMLTPETGAAGDGLVIHEASLPGEVLPVHRTYAFDGADATGAPVAAGDYRLTAITTDASTGVEQSTDGGTVRVRR